MVRDRAGRKSMSLAFTISDLRRRPEFFNTVAMRIWQAWWEAEGTSLDYISGRLRENMSDTPIPFALVAHDGFLRKAGLDPAGTTSRAQRQGVSGNAPGAAAPSPSSDPCPGPSRNSAAGSPQ